MEFRRITDLPPYVFTIIDSLKIESRRAGDDVIDVTYNYLLNGAANYLSPGDGGAFDRQIIALTSDGVAFSADVAKNPDGLSKPDAANAQQGHPDVSAAFPYSAPPF